MKHIKQDFSLKAWVQPLGGLRGWSRGQNSSCLVMLDIELTGMPQHGSKYLTCRPDHGGRGQYSTFSEHGHVAYEI